MADDIYLSFVASTVSICLLFALAYALLAVRNVNVGASLAFSLAFSLTALTWALAALLPQDGKTAGLSLLLTSTTGSVGMTAMWCALWLRAGQAINWWFMGCLVAAWMVPVLVLLAIGNHAGSPVPFACASIAAGVTSSVWHLLKKQGSRNVGDRLLMGWLILLLPVALIALLFGMGTSPGDPDVVRMFYLSFLPTLFTGVGLFSLLAFTLATIHDSTQLALTDSLTGLQNRRAFDHELAVAVARAERYQRDLTLMLVDIDHFKSLNDSHGHPTGDAVIRAVARVLLERSRSIDSVARVGGEEFALILADTPSAAALRLAERLRQAVSRASSENIMFTASFGVSSIRDTESSAAAMVQAADEALYAAKKAGRDCVRYAADPEREPTSFIELVQ